MVKHSIWAAGLVIFVAFFDLFIQFPVVAPYARSLGATPAFIGIIIATYSATNLIGNLVAGLVLDRWGRKRPVLGGLLVTTVTLLFYILVWTPWQLLATRMIHGLAVSLLTPGAFAILGDTAAADRRARVMGVSGAIIAFTAMIGPPFAGIVRDRVGVGAVFMTSAVLMLAAAGLFGRFGRETAAITGADRLQPKPFGASYLALWTRPPLVTSYLAALALTVGLGTLVTHLPLAMSASGESASRTGFAYTIFALVAMIVMAGPLNRLSDRVGRLAPLATGLTLITVGLLILGMVSGFLGVALGMAVFGLGFGLLFPSAAALVAEASHRQERGAAFGIFYALYSLGVVIGSVVSGVLNDWLGDLTGAPFLVAAAVALVTVPTILLTSRRMAAAVGMQPSP